MREQVKEKLDAKVKAILDSHPELEKDLNEVLSLQKEYDVVPVELDIPVDSVQKRYEISPSMEIVRTEKEIFLHSTCFWVVSRPTLANGMQGGALYETLNWLCDYMDGRDGYPDDMKESYDTIVSLIVNILCLPLDAFCDMSYDEEVDGETVHHDYMLEVSHAILELRGAHYAKVWEQASRPNPETAADDEAIQQMQAELAFSESLGKEVQMMAKNAENAAKRRSS